MKAAVFSSLHEHGQKLLESSLEVVYGGWAVSEPVLSPLPTDEEILVLAQDADAIIVPGELSAAVINACPHLKVIGVARGDPRGVDLDAATARGIAVVYAAGRNAVAVAELTLAFIIVLFRQLFLAQQFVANGRWRTWGDLFATTLLNGWELSGRTLGLIGLGYVGREVAKRARAFDMKLLVTDPYVSADEVAHFGGRKVDLPDLLTSADVVSIHCTVTDETRGLIGAKEIGKMKPGAYLVNTARAAVVDEEALLAALQCGRLAGAALDVYWAEPLPFDNPFIGLPNVLHTPHIGSGTIDVEPRTTEMIVRDVLAVLRGDRPIHLANPTILS